MQYDNEKGYIPVIEDNENVYDTLINPLMTQIIDICSKHGIPMIATFVYAPDNYCTTSLPGPLTDRTSFRLNEACKLIRGTQDPPGFELLTKVVNTDPVDEELADMLRVRKQNSKGF